MEYIFDVGAPNDAGEKIRGFLDLSSREIIVYSDATGGELFRIGNAPGGGGIDYGNEIKSIQAELKMPSSLNFFKEYIYSVGELTTLNVWTSDAKTVKIYQVDYVYGGDNLTSITTTRVSDGFSYLKELGYDVDGNLTSNKVTTP